MIMRYAIDMGGGGGVRRKPPSGRPGQVDFPFGQVTFSPSLPEGQAVHD